MQVFNDIFAEDNYTPIMCESQEDYLILTSQFPYKDKELERVHKNFYVSLILCASISNATIIVY